MPELPIPLKIAIVDGDRTSAAILKTITQSHPGVEAVETFDERHDAEKALHQGFNSLFVDVFTMGTTIGVNFIEHVREKFPLVPICLWSTTANLIEMPDVSEHWRERFGHYYKLPKDQDVQRLKDTASQVLDALATTLQIDIARRKVDSLVELTTVVSNQQQRSEITEAVETIQGALRSREKRARAVATTVVPGVNTSRIEDLVTSTLDAAGKSLDLTAKVNIGVLIAGSVLVFASFVVASVTNHWGAVAFGGFGIAGVIASLIANPLRSIGVSARRLVQIHVAYLGFLSQLALLNRESDKSSELERSQRLGEEMARSLQVLKEHFGK